MGMRPRFYAPGYDATPSWCGDAWRTEDARTPRDGYASWSKRTWASRDGHAWESTNARTSRNGNATWCTDVTSGNDGSDDGSWYGTEGAPGYAWLSRYGAIWSCATAKYKSCTCLGALPQSTDGLDWSIPWRPVPHSLASVLASPGSLQQLTHLLLHSWILRASHSRRLSESSQCRNSTSAHSRWLVSKSHNPGLLPEPNNTCVLSNFHHAGVF